MTDLAKKDKQFVWHPFTPQEGNLPQNIIVTKAEGCYLYTEDNRKIIDAISSWWVNLHGHSHPKIADAIAQQAKKLEHVMFAGFTHEPAIKLAENLLQVLPQGFSKVFYSDNGSTANEVALKMAIQYWHNKGIRKKKVVAIDGAYHGDTFGAMAVGERGVFSAPFDDYLFEVSFIDFPNEHNQNKVINQFQELINTNDVGAFIAEPLIQGAAGMRTYSAEILDILFSLAKKKDIICIADEVFTGFYRTGKFFASDYLTYKPDIMALSKGITGGAMPLGATACTDSIYQAFLSSDLTKAFLHGHSYTGNPLACAAANASFELLQSDQCHQSINTIAASHADFATIISRHENVKNARSLGTILAIEIKTHDQSGYTNSLSNKILHYFIDKNILLRPLGNVIYIVPPYCINQFELQVIYNEITKFIDSLNF
jgi:adenosylmethionine---8-amino-7-oxononanoate aminotransferase